MILLIYVVIYSSILYDDYCYVDGVLFKKRKIDFIDLFINVVVILFLEYEYKCIEFEDLFE